MVLQSTLTGALRMHGTPRMHSGAAGGGAAGGPVVGNMEIGTADGQITMTQANSGEASGGPRVHQLQNKPAKQLQVVLQSTLDQVHKLQNMLYQLHQHFWI